MSDASIRVRFAPSPSGHLHIGGARTALFNWLFARHHADGAFILRIEDTDAERSTQESIQAILDSLRWLGLDWDEEPYFQSQRRALYQEHVQRLLDAGKAYHCYCSKEELEAMREEAKARGDKPRYDGRCRSRSAPVSGVTPVVRFKTEPSGSTVVHDLVLGDVEFSNAELDDLIIQRSDGSVTYNFAVVVDDSTMAMTHIIRGNDHLNNTPRQILLYQGLGAPIPQFAHIPLILGTDKARLSKRHGATSVLAYRDMGYLPQALVNYLARLGWSHGDQEIFSLDELVQLFTTSAIGKTAGVFNPEKLQWLNSVYLRQTPPRELAAEVAARLGAQGAPVSEQEAQSTKMHDAIASLLERSKTLEELANSARYYFVDEVEFEPKAEQKFLTAEAVEIYETVIGRLEELSEVQEPALEAIFKDICENRGVKLVKVAQPVRVALTGGTVSPGIYEVMRILGKDTAVRRLRRAIDYIGSRSSA